VPQAPLPQSTFVIRSLCRSARSTWK